MAQLGQPQPMQRAGTGVQIGTLAGELGLNPKTIRYYEQIGLLPPPRRTQSGYRVYDAATSEQLRFIRKAKAIGLTLGEIGEILELWRGNTPPCANLAKIIDQKLAAIDEQLRTLGEFRQELATLREETTNYQGGEGTFCRIIEGHSQPAHERSG